jgi:hypothetical protein
MALLREIRYRPGPAASNKKGAPVTPKATAPSA